MDLTLVIPAKKEKESLPQVLEELKNYPYKIIVVLEENDTETINAIKNYNIELLFQTGKGYGDALIQGINNVKTDLFCIFNADGSFNPSELEI
jgi:glycosyltransferase involved in cell wall biosynthesis